MRKRNEVDLDAQVQEFLDGLAGIIAEDILQRKEAQGTEADGDAAGGRVKNC